MHDLNDSDFDNAGEVKIVSVGLCTVSLTDTAVQLTGVDGGGSTSVHPFGSTEQHQTETGGYKIAVDGCRQLSIVLTSRKMMIIISILRI